MKFIDEYRNGPAAQRLAAAIARMTTRDHVLMEICGGQTHTIVKFGIDTLLPERITLIHGPGCPVCVTPVAVIDKAIALAQQPQITLCSFGDMLRVPGSTSDLLRVKAAGGDVRMVYSPLDAVDIAERLPDREVVFLAVGFETTAPANAMAVRMAAVRKIENFSILVSHVLVPPAMESILSSPDNRVQGFLAAGHVCAIMGYTEYVPIAKRYNVPVVVTGFEPLDILQGVAMCIKQLEEGRAEVENQYSRAVRRRGNIDAQALMRDVFAVVSRDWRGLGTIPHSGLGLAQNYARFDAEKKFNIAACGGQESPLCLSGMILQGHKKPHDCAAFGVECTPEHPLGAPMVSSEGACAAYYRYRDHDVRTTAV